MPTPLTAVETASAEPSACTEPLDRIGLADLRPGQTAVIHQASTDPADAAILRAMGLRPNTRVRLCRRGEPCIVSVLNGEGDREGCRIGLARLLASRVLVQLV